MPVDPYNLPLSASKSLAELHELINVAEQVTYDLSKSRSLLWKQIIYVFTAANLASVCLFVFGFKNPSMFPLPKENYELHLFIIIFLSSFMVTYVIATFLYLLNKKKWRLEQEIVAEILSMSSGILENVQKHIGSVEYTLLKMRMRRLGLSDQQGIYRFISL